MKFLLCFLLLFAGCSSLQESYVRADRLTYEYAQPKLVEWAEMKAKEGDKDWLVIVRNKGISWESRIARAEKSLESD